ncbi:MAG: GNAT family N-acetyltransferase [Candidatus Eiseniibacteriota bacterium]|jgi:CelD/BcsL family acetyltransferase involved in cellulose biosynthesis
MHASGGAGGAAITREIRNVSEGEWWDWIAHSGDATFFQTPIWARLVVDSFPDARVDTRIFELGDGARVLVPLIRRQRLGGLVVSLESMPFGTYGGFLAERLLERPEMIAMLDALRRSHPAVSRLMVTPNPLGRFAIPEDIFVCQNFVHFLRLDEGYDRIWKSRFSRGLRYSVRKSLRRGATVEQASGPEAFADFARLYHETARRWERRPPFHAGFFDNLSRLDPSHVQLWVTRVEGAMASGVVIFTFGEHQTPYLGGFDRAYTGYDPNNLMYAEAMKWGARQGLRYFNFLSSAGIKGVEHFKSSFGTQRVFFNFFLDEHPAVRALRALRG